MFDVGCLQSFENLRRWLDEARTFCGDDVALLLIGNKIDIAGDFSREKAVDFAKSNNMQFALCSAKTKEGVGEAFDEVARRVSDRSCDTSSGKTVKIATNERHHASGCC